MTAREREIRNGIAEVIAQVPCPSCAAPRGEPCDGMTDLASCHLTRTDEHARRRRAELLDRFGNDDE